MFLSYPEVLRKVKHRRRFQAMRKWAVHPMSPLVRFILSRTVIDPGC